MSPILGNPRLNSFMALSDPGGLRTFRLGMRIQF
jgi:hypothetical protein